MILIGESYYKYALVKIKPIKDEIEFIAFGR